MVKAKTETAAPDTTLDAEIEKIIPKGAKFEGSTGPATEVKITRFGAKKGVSTGEHISGQGDRMAVEGDVLVVHESVAKDLESKGLAEIQ